MEIEGLTIACHVNNDLYSIKRENTFATIISFGFKF